MITSATELRRLVDAGRIAQAIALCERGSQAEVGQQFYKFWLARLQAAGRTGARSPGARPALPMEVLAPLYAAFRAHPYTLPPPVAPAPGADLPAARAALVAQSPFKSEIYLPTAKLPLTEQVLGLQRVKALVQPAQLEITRLRFEALRQHVQGMGRKRIFVIGNGPSLKKTDLDLLRDEVTIGFNGIFLHESFTPTIYVVEDHLVAEDRVREIHDYECPVKVFPSYLGYCIEPQENTIFLNHRGRISYPVDTDFSADAGRISYTGGTVTYTGLQIAASLGAQEIVLIGVDASYQVHNVERSDSYGTGVLTSTQDDTNHFDPRYFGKGFRWHDPNVHTMLQAYRKARDHGRANGVNIVNASLGGELEVFPRVDFHQLFARDRAYPRLAVLDFTSVQRLSATGIIKRNLLAGWPKSSQLHVHSDEKARLLAFQNIAHDLYAKGSDDNSVWPAFRALVEFDPQVLYLRPTPERVPMTVLQTVAAIVMDRPWLIHYMDDWLEKAHGTRGPTVAAAYRALMAFLFDGAESVLAISAKMARYLETEFHLPPDRLQVVHNFLPPVAARVRKALPAAGDRRRVVRYFGALEPDMGLATLREVARQIEAYNRAQADFEVMFEIYTAPNYIQRHAADFAGTSTTRLLPQFEGYEHYLEQLGSSDLNLLCYNFDAQSLAYVRFSLANKLPELLAAGVPFLAIGHAEIGTMELLRQAGYPLLLTDSGFRIDTMLQSVLSPNEDTAAAYHASLASLQDEFSEPNNRGRTHWAVRRAAMTGTAEPVRPAIDAAPQVAALSTLLQASGGGLKHSGDLECLVQLALQPRTVLAPMLKRIRSHGLTWSVRDELQTLSKLVRTAAEVAASPDEMKARLLAVLVASMGHERFNPLNDPVRSWLCGSGMPAASAQV